MTTVKQRLFSNWHLMRIIRLALSIWILVAAIKAGDVAIGILGAFFLYTALAGVGCCGTAGCAVPAKYKHDGNAADVDYEEIK